MYASPLLPEDLHQPCHDWGKALKNRQVLARRLFHGERTNVVRNTVCRIEYAVTDIPGNLS
jgi:hypothetical protein